MAIVPSLANGGLVAMDPGGGLSMESLRQLMAVQRELFHSQADSLRRFVALQCQHTGENPLSQEMAAGALSIKIGKKPRNLLNPKAIKCMQSIFSIKDTIGKKETREISALCGITATQVRDYFAGQRSRVRKLVKLSCERAAIVDSSKASIDGCISSSLETVSFQNEADIHLVDISVAKDSVQFSEIVSSSIPATTELQLLGISADMKPSEGPSCSQQEENMIGVDLENKKFLENILTSMLKEESFIEQVKLMERVLRVKDTAALNCFLTTGTICHILAKWLGEATIEEQSTVILVIFKVLKHLLSRQTLPKDISTLVHAVNQLRFYRVPDIADKANSLLRVWSKLFARQVPKKSYTNLQKDPQMNILTLRFNENCDDEQCKAKVDNSEDILALPESTEFNRKLEPNRTLKSLPIACDESFTKPSRNTYSPKIKERRKVLLVEQTDRKITSKSQVWKSIPSNSSRPLSADDIQKAKMKAIYLQDKYGKIGPSTNEHQAEKAVNIKDMHASGSGKMLPILGMHKHARNLESNDKKLLKNTSSRKPDASLFSEASPSTTLERKMKNGEIQWHVPPETKIDSSWRVGAGESSKEIALQTQRLNREETFYANQDIPPNPKEPWDMEMDFDDSLTPEIPIEQPQDAEASPCPSDCPPSYDAGLAQVASSSGAAGTEPDLELLAVLLKNPEVVFALTSGQGNNLNNEQIVELLDMLKKGSGSIGTANGIPEPASLPSPTPSSERKGWRSEAPTFNNNLQSLQLEAPLTLSAVALPTPAAPIQHSSTSIALTTQPPVGRVIQQFHRPPVAINDSRHDAHDSVVNDIVSRRLKPHIARPSPTLGAYAHHGSTDYMLQTMQPSVAVAGNISLVQNPNFEQLQNHSSLISANLYQGVDTTATRSQPAQPQHPSFPSHVQGNVPMQLRSAELGMMDETWNRHPNRYAHVLQNSYRDAPTYTDTPDPYLITIKNSYPIIPQELLAPSVIHSHNRANTDVNHGVGFEMQSLDTHLPRFEYSRDVSDMRRNYPLDHQRESYWDAEHHSPASRWKWRHDQVGRR